MIMNDYVWLCWFGFMKIFVFMLLYYYVVILFDFLLLYMIMLWFKKIVCCIILFDYVVIFNEVVWFVYDYVVMIILYDLACLIMLRCSITMCFVDDCIMTLCDYVVISIVFEFPWFSWLCMILIRSFKNICFIEYHRQSQKIIHKH